MNLLDEFIIFVCTPGLAADLLGKLNNNHNELFEIETNRFNIRSVKDFDKVCLKDVTSSAPNGEMIISRGDFRAAILSAFPELEHLAT